MKSLFINSCSLRGALVLSLLLGLGNVASGKPSIRSVSVTPSTLTIAQPFTLTVAASPDVTQATAVIDFWKATPEFFQIALTKQGTNWVSSNTVPLELLFADPHKAVAKIRVLVLDAALRQDELIVQFPVIVPNITAIWAAGVLTITADDQDNTVIASRDAAGKILVNGGAVPITGGVATVTNTTLIRMFGLKGNDTLQVSDATGPMPSANLIGGEGDDVLTGSASNDQLDGGPGNDTLTGRSGDDILLGGPGNDTLIGGLGEDQLIGGEGDDQFVWNPGDASDVVEGQDGDDTLVFNGSAIGEVIDLSANGQRLRFTRNIAGITMDCAGVERVMFHALSGTDKVVVNDLAGTEVDHVIVDLTSTTGLGDGQPDIVQVNGTETNDVITISGSSNRVDVVGLAADVTVIGFDPSGDDLIINALGGDDVIDATAVEVGAMHLTLNGGLGSDQLLGGQGNDLLIGGRDNDFVAGGPGDDTLLWNPGDGSDTLEGQAGQDVMLFNGANINETIEISANGERVKFTRDVAGISMDCHEVEIIAFNAFGGADKITIDDLSGTGVAQVKLDLLAPATSGSPDGAADTVIVNGTTGSDAVVVTGSQAGVTVNGLAAMVSIVGSDPALDQLILHLLAGDDSAEASTLPAGLISLILDGGPGDDVLVGSAGADVLIGDEGDDVLLGGPGFDILDGGPGSNVLIQD